MMRPRCRILLTLLIIYGAASLVHFVHNAEFLRDYPSLPDWSRTDIYVAWLTMTIIGLAGWFLLRRGFPIIGFIALGAYAVLGLDSLGHYVVAPMSAHTFGMNATILLEVTCAGLVLVEVMRQLTLHLRRHARS